MQSLIPEERGISDLFSELANETGTLMRQELALAQAEMTKKAVETGKRAAWFGLGTALAFAALLTVTAAIVLLLAYLIPLWLSAFIGGITLAAAAYFTISSATVQLKKTDLAPRETVETLKEDVQWLKKTITS
jgi:hypothetical protein